MKAISIKHHIELIFLDYNFELLHMKWKMDVPNTNIIYWQNKRIHELISEKSISKIIEVIEFIEGKIGK